MPDDKLILTIRLADPREKKSAALAASWITAQVDRADLQLAPDAFATKYILPRLDELEQRKAKQPPEQVG